MPDLVSLLEKHQIIEIKSYGDVTINDLKTSLSLVNEIHENTGITKVLVDARDQKSLPSTSNIFEFGVQLPYKLHFALVIDKDQKTGNDVHFLETVAFNRGFTINTFTSRITAIDWLNNYDTASDSYPIKT